MTLTSATRNDADMLVIGNADHPFGGSAQGSSFTSKTV
jgi:hypothetical protein